ncbi:hypothetical protein [Polyangium sp. 6x1]|uniref:hypothetical protein n=1 Tax=Polyangium sp. 6x1 TaxID=3042689 RepID=UPI002482E579|nr:hypothetical protein [Polyangium sp. 6x1]MDI1450789.1 hypothetical protein [Polyangium sp. 6x1]
MSGDTSSGKCEPAALDYFCGGVPTGMYFRMTLDDIRAISAERARPGRGIDRLQEICFVGALSYFESFCKDHFASLINIEPRLIEHLKNSGHDVTVDASFIASCGPSIAHRIGFLLAEKYDFGTAHSINAVYAAILNIAPFSKDETQRFSTFLRDRNLLVRHGGMYTMNYLAANPRLAETGTKYQAFWESRVIDRDDVLAAIEFLEAIAKRMVRDAHDTLSTYVESKGIVYDDERREALSYVLWWGDEHAP